MEKHDAALIALDKLDKIGSDGVKNEFAARGVDQVAGDRLLSFFSDLGSLEHAAEIAAEDKAVQALNKAVLGRIVEFVKDNELGAKGVDELQSILDFAEAMGISDRLKIDPTTRSWTFLLHRRDYGDQREGSCGQSWWRRALRQSGGNVFGPGYSGVWVLTGARTNSRGDGREEYVSRSELASSPADVMVAIWNEDSIAESIELAQELTGRRVAS